MGIMHKLFKRRDLERQSLIMDLTLKSKDNSNNKHNNQPYNSDMTSLHDDELLPKLATEDNQFTAEHIVQLCKFLAEKSKRNNMLNKRLPSSLSSSPTHSPTHSHSRGTGKLKFRTQYQREANSNRETLEAVNHMSCTRLIHNNDIFLLESSSSQANTTTHILTDKLIKNSNVFDELNQRNYTPTTINKHSSAQEKRDILLKIRKQIFERKRQRELMEQQMDVWRPW